MSQLVVVILGGPGLVLPVPLVYGSGFTVYWLKCQWRMPEWTHQQRLPEILLEDRWQTGTLDRLEEARGQARGQDKGEAGGTG